MALFASGRSEVATVEARTTEVEGEATIASAKVVEDSFGPDELRRQALDEYAEAVDVDGRVDIEGPGPVGSRGWETVIGCEQGLSRVGSRGPFGGGEAVTGA